MMHASLRHYRIEPKNMDELLRRIPGAVDVIGQLSRPTRPAVPSLSLQGDHGSKIAVG